MRKIMILVGVVIILSLNITEIAYTEKLSVVKRFGVGIQSNILNLSIIRTMCGVLGNRQHWINGWCGGID